jgi:hypothetical protein
MAARSRHTLSHIRPNFSEFIVLIITPDSILADVAGNFIRSLADRLFAFPSCSPVH